MKTEEEQWAFAKMMTDSFEIQERLGLTRIVDKKTGECVLKTRVKKKAALWLREETKKLLKIENV